ncbi:MAG: PD-(D/E)XK nuclease family protein [Candidatus Aenigmatarchaeota archaeon]
MDKSLVWSSSKLATILDCPRAFKYRYIDHEPAPKDIRAAFGTAIHYFLEQFYKKNYKSPETFCNAWNFYWNLVCDDRDVNEIDQKLSKMYEKLRKRYGHISTWNEEKRRYIVSYYRRLGENILKEFYNRHKGRKRPIAVEKRFKIDFDGFKLIGNIDRIDEITDNGKYENGLYITDYKTDKRCPEKDDLLLRKHHQLTFYNLAFKDIFGTEPKGIFIYHLRSMKIIPTKRTEEDVEYLLSSLRKAKRIIDEKEFEPYFGFHCNLCEYLSICQKREVVMDIAEMEESDELWGIDR